MRHIVIMINCEDEDAENIIEEVSLQFEVLEQEGDTGPFNLQVDVYDEDSLLVLERGGAYGRG